MSIPKMRPTFLLTVDLTHDQAIEKLRGLIEHADGRFTGKVVGRHVMLTVCEQDRHFWSPWLDMEVLEVGGGETDDGGPHTECGAGDKVTVRGRFMPHPNIWTAYMAGYFGLATFSMFAAIYAYAQWVTESSPTGLWGAGLGALITIGLWWSAQVGQKLARGQMEVLREVVGKVII